LRFFASEQFKVKIPRIGTEIDVPVNQTMLDALESAGVEVIFAAKVSADYARCRFWSEEEKAAHTKLCTCVSRVIGSITVDTADR
jgi:vanillate O-demethylase ferredoxin subunit